MRIILAIDLYGGKCVRLSQGDYAKQTQYSDSPLEVAKQFEDHGIQYLHLVDLEGAKSNKIVHHETLYKIASNTNLTIDFGGGIKRNEDVEIAFDNGANQITAGSIAVKNPFLFLEWINKYGVDKIILGADCKNKKISIQGWKKTTEKEIIQFIQDYETKGVRYVICTDISKDGMLRGPQFDLYREIREKSAVDLIASGGVSSIDHLVQLKQLGCEGVIIGKAIYENYISLNELKQLDL